MLTFVVSLTNFEDLKLCVHDILSSPKSPKCCPSRLKVCVCGGGLFALYDKLSDDMSNLLCLFPSSSAPSLSLSMLKVLTGESSGPLCTLQETQTFSLLSKTFYPALGVTFPQIQVFQHFAGRSI